MKIKSIIIHTVLAFIFGVFISFNANSQTAGSLSFNVTTTFTGGSWGSASNFVVWIEDASGSFVKTRILYGSETDHLMQWSAKSPSMSITDATTGATKTTNPFVYPAIIWTGNDITGSSPYNLLPDGTYNVSMELAWASSKVLGTGRQIYTATFVKGPSPQTVTPTNQTNFTGMTLQWTPATAVSVTTSALSASSYCASSAVSVPFTKGTGTIYNNNVWTVQLSNASGSFLSPVTIGTLNGAAAGSVSCTIPAGTASGTGYRIRVVGSQPASIGTDNGTDITITGAPAVPSIGTIAQPTCTSTYGSVTLNGLPASGTWTVNPGNISGSGTSTTVSGLAANTYNFTVTSTCGVSSATGNVVINAQPATPAAPTVGTITHPTCAVATGGVVLTGLPATGNWTLTRSPGGSTTNGTGTSKTISGLAAGNYTYTVTNSLGCMSSVSNNVVINAQPATPAAPSIGTITHPTCTVSTGSVDLSGLPSGAWTITRTPGNIVTTGSGATTNISGIASGIYTYTVNDGTCTSLASSNVVVNAQLPTPTAPVIGTITHPTCTSATGSVVLNGLPATGSWSLTRTPGNVVTTGNGLTTTIAGLATDTYNFIVTNSVNCVSVASANVVINAQPALPATPIVGTITQPSCSVADASVNFSGLPATGTWSITRSPGNIITPGVGATTVVTGIPASGTYTFQVSNAAGCTSLATANVVVNAQPLTPSVTSQSASVLTGGTFVVSPASVPVGTTYTWDVPSYTGGVTGGSAQATPQTEISGTLLLAAGTGTATYIVTPALGSCTGAPFTVTVDVSSSCNAVTIGTPNVANSTICATGNTSFTVVANGTALTYAWQYYNGTTWANVVNNTPAGAVYTNANTATLNVSGITSTNTFQYRCYITNCNGNNNATSNVATLTVNPLPTVITVGTITQPTCGVATGTVAVSALPATGTWTVNPGNFTGSGTTTTLIGLSSGTYNFTVTNSASCTSVPTSNVVIITQPVTPAAPAVGTITQPTCNVTTGTVVLNGLPASGSWTLNPGNIVGTGTSKTLSGLATGTTTYTVKNADLCTSVASANVVINAAPSPQAAPTIGTITQPTCALATGSVVLNNLPATGNWTVNPGNISGFGSSLTIPGVTVGTHTYTVTNNTACTSVASANVVINAQPTTPSAPVVGALTHPTCALATGSAVLSGLPATGTWTLTRVADNATTTGSGVSTTVSGIMSGTYNYKVTNSVGCTSVVSQDFVINAQPETPIAPMVGTINSPTCSVLTGSVLLYNLPTTGSWTLNPGNINGSGSTYTVSGLASGNLTFKVTNAAGCISAASANVAIPTHAVTPATPSITININVLHSSAATGNQWYNSNGIIIGATAQDLTVMYNTGYYVIVNDGVCASSPSNTINVTNVGIQNVEKNNKISVYPNPFTNELAIEAEGNQNIKSFEIFNAVGHVVYIGHETTKAVVSTTNFASGMYLLRIQTNNTTQYKKIIKE